MSLTGTKTFPICSQVIDAADMTERHAAALARVAEVAERLAMKHADRALETDDPKVEASATAAFQKATRVMRQAMALEAKLVRDAQREDREAQRRAEWADLSATQNRRREVEATVERLIRDDAGCDAERLCDELDDLLDLEELTPTFLTEDLTAQVARLCKTLGLKGIEVLAVVPSGEPLSPPLRQQWREGDRSPQSERWRGRAASLEFISRADPPCLPLAPSTIGSSGPPPAAARGR
jgi:hypothetical protein